MSLNTKELSKWLHRFAALTALATLALVGAGGLVTSHGVGLAVPDWPNTYGYNMFFFPFSKWVGGVFYEHSHRLIAAGVGLLTWVLAMWLWSAGTRRSARYWGLGAMLAVLVLMGVRQMPVYYTLAALAPITIAACLYLTVREWRKERAGKGIRGLSPERWLRWLGAAAFAAVVLQGVLGGLRVVWLKDQIGILHAALAQLFFVLVCAIALFTSRWWRAVESSYFSSSSLGLQGIPGTRKRTTVLPRFILGTTLLILFQLILGATMRHQHAGLAIPDFPLAYGTLWPAMDAASVAHYNQQRVEVLAANPITAFQVGLQMAHRLMALTILAAVAYCAWATRRQPGAKGSLTKLAWSWLGLICLQALLGAATIWSGKAADIATAHVVLGALALAAGGMLTLIAFQAAQPSVTSISVTSITEEGLEGTAENRPTSQRWRPAAKSRLVPKEGYPAQIAPLKAV